MAFALYIHWPFCLAKCPYCDFNSHVRERTDMAAWQTALLADMAHEAALTGGRELTSIFFGGGTPSLMPPALVASLIEAASRHWAFAPDIEITLEANPSSVEAANFAALAGVGINRVSLGLQALDDTALTFLGRLHNASEGLAALEVAQRHFARVSFDLIYARPDHTPALWEAELSRALALGTGHLSLYQLTIEPDTMFERMVAAGKLTPMPDDEARILFDTTRETCEAAGFPAYEISNHARKGAECRHNLLYWRYGEYAGIGPGAHARLFTEQGRVAIATEKHPETWLKAVKNKGHGTVEEERLAPLDQANEFLLMGLRLTEGIDPSRFEALAGRPLDQARVIEMIDDGFVAQAPNGHLYVTKKGVPVLNAVVGRLTV